MSAEQLIGLQAALAEVSKLYVVARRFVALRGRAESELLPVVQGLASQLRSLLRHAALDDAAVDRAARTIADLKSSWRAELDNVQRSTEYRACLAAWNSDDATVLRELLPRVIAGIRWADSAPPLHCAVPIGAPRRRPGSRPFISPEACAEKILKYRDEGVSSDDLEGEWWDVELTFIELAGDPAALDSPISLRFESVVPVPITVAEDGAFRAYTRLLRAPFSVHLQATVTDEWWAAFDETYDDYRAKLGDLLERHGLVVSVSEAG